MGELGLETKGTLLIQIFVSEAVLVQDPYIAAAVVFGSGRAQVGVLIQPKEPFDTSDRVKVRSFRDIIWYANSRRRIRYAEVGLLPSNIQTDCRAS